jgi:phosphatidylglycerol---prolipoprotein diacylglyceryl transferase
MEVGGLMVSVLAYYVHHLNPIIVNLGPIQPRWYGFAYLMGFLGAYLLIQKSSRDGMLRLAPDKVPDLVLNGCIFGVLVGGRLGFVLFYDLPNALRDHVTPLLWSFEGSFPYWGLLRVNKGGMSAHGGVVFTILALIWFARKYKVSVINIGDAACMVVPIGLFFGRIANFINGELYGHPSSVAWAVKFPSEIYAPTNGNMEVPASKLLQMQQAVAAHIGLHWPDLSSQEVRDFVSNNDHRDLHDLLVKQFGALDFNSVTQLSDMKRTIATYVTMDPTSIMPADLGEWWQHGHDALTQVMGHWFDTILPARHPSQLYEALLEGALLFVICWTIGRIWRKDGMASGAFLTFYPIMRIIGEHFRVGDSALSGSQSVVSAGVILSLAMFVPGVIYWIYWIKKDRRVPWVPVAKSGAPVEIAPAVSG